MVKCNVDITKLMPNNVVTCHQHNIEAKRCSPGLIVKSHQGIISQKTSLRLHKRVSVEVKSL